jgi:hypothetical protein
MLTQLNFCCSSFIQHQLAGIADAAAMGSSSIRLLQLEQKQAEAVSGISSGAGANRLRC